MTLNVREPGPPGTPSPTREQAVITADRDGRIVFWSHGAELAFGFTAAEAVGRPLSLIIPERYQAAHNAGMERVRRTGHSALTGQVLKLEARRSSGEEFPIELTLETWITGDEVLFTAVIRDRTVRDSPPVDDLYGIVTETLADHESFAAAAPVLLARLGEALGCAAGTVWHADPSARMRPVEFWSLPGRALGEFREATMAMSAPLGVDIPGRVWAERTAVWLADAPADPNFPRGAAARASGLHTAFAFPVVARDHVLAIFEFLCDQNRSVSPALVNAMSYAGIQIGIFVERERAEIARRQSEQRYRVLFEQSLAGIFRIALDGRILEANDAFAHAFGYDTSSELVQRSIYDLYADPIDRERLLTAVFSGSTDGQPTVVRGRCKDASERWILIMLGAMTSGENPSIQGTLIDITRQKQERDALARTTELLKRAEELADVGSFEQNLLTRRVVWSDAVYRFAGIERTSDDLSVEAASASVHPEDRGLVADAMRDAISTGAIVTAVLRLVRADGEVRIMRSRAAAEYDADGTAVRILGTIYDQTDDARAEQERIRLRDEVERIRRIAGLGQMAASIAHEFNNVLMAIQPHIEVIKRKLAGAAAPPTASFEHVGAAIARGKRITGDILEFTRGGSLELQLINVRPFFASFANAVRNLKLPGVTTEYEAASRDAWINADAARLTQALMNLVVNARDAMPDGGTLRLVVAVPTPDAPSPQIVFAVEDSGSGLSPEAREHIFEPLFSTKGRPGSGLGLAIARQIVRGHGGELEIADTGPEGTRFALALPEITQVDTALPSENVASALPRQFKRVLLVEDDQSVAAGITDILHAEGLETALVTHGRNAVNAIDRWSPDIVVLDVGLPDISGWEVLDLIQLRHPTLPVVISSGHASAAEAPPGVAVLQKPYTAQQLVDTLAGVWGRG